MGLTPGMMPIFKTGVLRLSGAQPTESYGKSMDFGLIFVLFRGFRAKAMQNKLILLIDVALRRSIQ